MGSPFAVPVEERQLRDWAVSSVLSLATVMALVAVSYLGLDAVARNVADDRVDDRLASAVAVASVVDQAVAARVAAVQTAAAGVSPWTGSDRDRARTFTALERLASQVPELSTGLVAVGPGGAVVGSDRAHERLLGDTLTGPHIAAALAGTASMSPVLDDPIDGEASLQVASPLRAATGEVTGALVAFSPVDQGFLTAALARVAPTPGTELVLVGPGKAVVTRPQAGAGGSGELERDSLDTRAPAEAAAEGAGTLVYDGAGNVERFAAYAPVEGGWALVQHEPRSRIEALPAAVRRVGAGVGVVLVLTVAVALVLAERRIRGVRKDAERAKRSVLAVAGHELRTPLTVVRGMSTTAVARWDTLPDGQKLQLVQTVERQARTLEHLIERLLFAAHLEAGIAGMVDRRPIEVANLVRDAVAHHAAISPLHTITFEGGGTGEQGVGDRKALDQIVFHLLDNAVKYSPSGGTILVRVATTRRAVELSVEDEGVGLPADPSRLFEPFTQVEDVDTRTREEGGVGLGLYIVRSLAEQMGGAVRAEPSPSGGARFVVTLTRARADEPALVP